MFIFFGGILIIAVLGNFPDLLPHFAASADAKPKPISMTSVIQMVMLLVGAAILLTCNATLRRRTSATARYSAQASSPSSPFTASPGWPILISALT